MTANGELRPCLYLDRGIDLRPALHGGTNDGALDTRIAAALEMKPFENGLNPHHAPLGVPVMTTIGG